MIDATIGDESTLRRWSNVPDKGLEGEFVTTATSHPSPMLMWPTGALPVELRRVLVSTTALLGCSGLVIVMITARSWPMLVLSVSACMGSVALALWLTWTHNSPLSVSILSLHMVSAVILAVLAFAASTQPLSALATGLPFAFAIAWRTPVWLPAIAAVASASAASGAGVLLENDSFPARDGFTMLVLTGAATVAFTGTFVSWQLHLQLDRYNADQRELALARERLRFATDLHDIQGHSLLAIKLKTELARRSLDHNPDVTERELRNIEDLAVEAGDRTRDLAHGYRALPLTTELVNVEQLLGSAGIIVDIRMEGAPPQDEEHLFAELMREAASNILRHAAATEASIRIGDNCMTVSNNVPGVPEDAEVPPVQKTGNGLAGLQQRFAESGGSFAWREKDGCFTVVGKLGVAP